MASMFLFIIQKHTTKKQNEELEAVVVTIEITIKHDGDSWTQIDFL